MAGWSGGHGHHVVCFPLMCVFLESGPFHLLTRVSAVGCQLGFLAGSHHEITSSVAA